MAQENLFLEIFSVRESLEFAANLTMPSSSTKKEKEAKIDEVVKIMGLQSCKSSNSLFLWETSPDKCNQV